jgi:DNA-binding Lrp family transcriptional regulator
MDPIDFAVYRFMSPGGDARFWGGRRLIDPTIPSREISERVGISENAVRTRLRGLADQGFLRGNAVTPNPSLFDVRVFVLELAIKTPNEAEALFRDLALVEGVIFARDTMDEGDRHVRVYFVTDSDSSTARRAALIRRLAPGGGLRPPEPYAIPECDRALSPLDWKLLSALCHRPDAAIAEIAKTVRVSLKTAAKRCHQLTDSKACWWTLGPDSEEFPLALIWVDVQDPEHRASVAVDLARKAPAWMPVAGDGLGLELKRAATVIAGLVPADAPTALERLVAEFGRLPEVVRVLRTFPLGSKTYPAWFADRIAEKVSAIS